MQVGVNSNAIDNKSTSHDQYHSQSAGASVSSSCEQFFNKPKSQLLSYHDFCLQMGINKSSSSEEEDDNIKQLQDHIHRDLSFHQQQGVVGVGTLLTNTTTTSTTPAIHISQWSWYATK